MEDPLVTFETTSKGKPMVPDSNNYTQVANALSTLSTEVRNLGNVWNNTLPIEEYNLNLIANELCL